MDLSIYVLADFRCRDIHACEFEVELEFAWSRLYGVQRSRHVHYDFLVEKPAIFCSICRNFQKKQQEMISHMYTNTSRDERLVALGLWTHTCSFGASPRPGQLADEEAANCQLDDVLEGSEYYFKELISLLLSIVLLGDL